MSKIPFQNPYSGEIQSPLLAGLTEGLNKLSGILNVDVETMEDITLDNLPISSTDGDRIYEAPFGKKLWLQSPAPIIKKNGIVITQDVDFFTIDYIGGSITFENPILPSDIITVSASYITEKSLLLDELSATLADTTLKANRYKGYYANLEALNIAHPTAENGDIAFVVSPSFSIYSWDSVGGAWKNTQATVDLTQYYTKGEADNLYDEKEPNIIAKGVTTADDNFYYGGRKQWIDLFFKIRKTTLDGLILTDKTAVKNTDDILIAIGKLQAQATDLASKDPVALIETHNTSVQSHADIRTLATANSTAIEGLDTRLDSAETTIIAHNTKFNEVDTSITEITADLATANTNIGANTTAIGTLNTTVSGHTTKIGTLQTTVGQHTTSIGSLNTTVGQHTTSIGTLNTTVGQHTATIGQHTSDITAINAKIGAIATNLDTINGQVI